ncbi:MAG TPA: glycosyltransferase [Solirubrobacteraceae bacterium]|jgi:glycosyltransferase involved in cell wall biosynthesis|nr:glycosyltransferase [Solirubrobacteraceae bacterium]
MPSQTFVIVTAYNEADRVAATLRALASAFPQARVLLADDGSTDGTARIAAPLGARIVRSERTVGKGEAATLAAREALEHARAESVLGEAVFVLCDGDLGASAVALAALAQAIERGEADLAVAAFSRRVGGGFGFALGFARWAIRSRCGLQTTAPISGQRALSARALADVLPFAHGFGMEIGMTVDAVRAGRRVLEIELDLEHRASGRTPAGFAHRARQLADFVRVYLARGRLARARRPG